MPDLAHWQGTLLGVPGGLATLDNEGAVAQTVRATSVQPPVVTTTGAMTRQIPRYDGSDFDWADPDICNVVRDYGAVADWNGSTGTNNTRAFQDAIDENKIVLVPAGDYLLGPIAIGSRKALIGQGRRRTQFVAASGLTEGLIQVTARSDEFIELSGFTINGRKSVNTDAGAHGIHMYNAGAGSGYSSFADASHIIRDLLIYRTGGDGFRAEDVSGTEFRELYITLTNGHGFFFDRSSDNSISGLYVSTVANGKHGLYVTGSNNRIVNCKAFYCGDEATGTSDGIRIEAGRNVLAGIDSQDNGRYGIAIVGPDNMVSSAVCDSNGLGGFALDDSGNNTDGNYLTACTASSRAGGRYTQDRGFALLNGANDNVIEGTANGNTSNLYVDGTTTVAANVVRVTTDTGETGNVRRVVAETDTSGYTMVNGTGTILEFTTPNDGRMHAVDINGRVKISSAQTGGAVQVTSVTGGTSVTKTMSAGSHSVGLVELSISKLVVDPNTQVTISQSSALTGGAAKVFAKILSD